MMKKGIVTLLLIFYLMVNPLFSQENKVSLFFYRPSKLSYSMVNFKLFVNSEEVAKIANNSTVVWRTEQDGAIEIGVKTWDSKLKTISINAKRGNSYFFIITPDNLHGAAIESVAYESVKNIFPDLRAGNENLAVQQTPPATNQKGSISQAKDGKLVGSSVELSQTEKSKIVSAESDVDVNVPVTKAKNENSFALIIGNEDYSSYQNDLSSEVNVSYASNDASAFKEYAVKTLGIPQENVIFLVNARTVEMNRAINKLCLYAKTLNGNAELLFYYAGHGLPDENSKEAYIIPVDVSGSDLQFAVKLKDLYSKLTEYPSKKVTVFLDACFSGGARNQGLVAARGVKVKPKDDALNGNLVVFTASSGEQSSMPYEEKKHGLFTYFVLKRLQETKGDINYKDLSIYLTQQVSLNSIRYNSKEQNPQTIISPVVKDSWSQWNMGK